jgi:hypothetical protein
VCTQTLSDKLVLPHAKRHCGRGVSAVSLCVLTSFAGTLPHKVVGMPERLRQAGEIGRKFLRQLPIDIRPVLNNIELTTSPTDDERNWTAPGKPRF